MPSAARETAVAEVAFHVVCGRMNKKCTLSALNDVDYCNYFIPFPSDSFYQTSRTFSPPSFPSHPFILLSSPPSVPLASSAVWSMGLRHVAKLVEPSRPPLSPSPSLPSHPPSSCSAVPLAAGCSQVRCSTRATPCSLAAPPATSADGDLGGQKEEGGGLRTRCWKKWQSCDMPEADWPQLFRKTFCSAKNIFFPKIRCYFFQIKKKNTSEWLCLLLN